MDSKKLSKKDLWKIIQKVLKKIKRTRSPRRAPTPERALRRTRRKGKNKRARVKAEINDTQRETLSTPISRQQGGVVYNQPENKSPYAQQQPTFKPPESNKPIMSPSDYSSFFYNPPQFQFSMIEMQKQLWDMLAKKETPETIKKLEQEVSKIIRTQDEYKGTLEESQYNIKHQPQIGGEAEEEEASSAPQPDKPAEAPVKNEGEEEEEEEPAVEQPVEEKPEPRPVPEIPEPFISKYSPTQIFITSRKEKQKPRIYTIRLKKDLEPSHTLEQFASADEAIEQFDAYVEAFQQIEKKYKNMPSMSIAKKLKEEVGK